MKKGVHFVQRGCCGHVTEAAEVLQVVEVAEVVEFA